MPYATASGPTRYASSLITTTTPASSAHHRCGRISSEPSSRRDRARSRSPTWAETSSVSSAADAAPGVVGLRIQVRQRRRAAGRGAHAGPWGRLVSRSGSRAGWPSAGSGCRRRATRPSTSSATRSAAARSRRGARRSARSCRSGPSAGPARPWPRYGCPGRTAIVQHQHFGPADDRPGQGQPLPLPAGQGQALLADPGVEPPGQPATKSAWARRSAAHTSSSLPSGCPSSTFSRTEAENRVGSSNATATRRRRSARSRSRTSVPSKRMWPPETSYNRFDQGRQRRLCPIRSPRPRRWSHRAGRPARPRAAGPAGRPGCRRSGSGRPRTADAPAGAGAAAGRSGEAIVTGLVITSK